MTLIMKFGGTSVGTAEAMRNTAELILAYQKEVDHVVVVASGMGTKPVKVTDLLLDGVHSAADGNNDLYLANASRIRDIHAATIRDLLTTEQEEIITENNALIDRFENICQAVGYLGELSPRALDIVAGLGEQMSVPILAALLREMGHDAEAIDATGLIVTDSTYTNASPDFVATKAQADAKVRPILKRGGIPIVTGFVGADANGVTTTLGRGGSDYSAAIIGRVLDATEVWIWTDVDGVMTTDPRIVPHAQSIPVLTFREVSELAYYGAKVLHPKTMRPCVEGDIPLRIKNTFNPTHPGTVITEQVTDASNGEIKAVTAVRDLRLITVEGKGMMGVPGVAARTFGAVALANVNVLLITQASSEQSICFVTSAGTTQSTLDALDTEFAAELKRRDIDRIWAMNPVSIITIVGVGMRGTPGISGRVFTALGKINVIAMAQGSSECSISIVIDDHDAEQALTLLHDLIVAH